MFFCNDTATTESYTYGHTLSLHDALPISQAVPARPSLYGHGLLGSHDEVGAGNVRDMAQEYNMTFCAVDRTEEHTSELQSLMRISYAVLSLKKKRKGSNSRNTGSEY